MPEPVSKGRLLADRRQRGGNCKNHAFQFGLLLFHLILISHSVFLPVFRPQSIWNLPFDLALSCLYPPTGLTHDRTRFEGPFPSHSLP